MCTVVCHRKCLQPHPLTQIYILLVRSPKNRQILLQITHLHSNNRFPVFLSGNLGALAPPPESSMFSSPDVSETLFSDANKPKVEPTILLVERLKQLSKILARNEDATTLQNFLMSNFNRQAYKSTITGADTFF